MWPTQILRKTIPVLSFKILVFASHAHTGPATCPQGTYIDPAGRCSWCREGTYQDEVGAQQCKECRPGTISREIAATSAVACKNCPPATYATSSSTCAHCPPNTISPAGATDRSECSALPGYYGQFGEMAMGCPANHYCVSSTLVPTPCPDGTTSSALASSCTPGVESIVLYDWVFAMTWVALFLSGAVWLGAYKMVKSCYNNKTQSWSVQFPKTIRIRIVRSGNPESGAHDTTK